MNGTYAMWKNKKKQKQHKKSISDSYKKKEIKKNFGWCGTKDRKLAENMSSYFTQVFK